MNRLALLLVLIVAGSYVAAQPQQQQLNSAQPRVYRGIDFESPKDGDTVLASDFTDSNKCPHGPVSPGSDTVFTVLLPSGQTPIPGGQDLSPTSDPQRTWHTQFLFPPAPGQYTLRVQAYQDSSLARDIRITVVSTIPVSSTGATNADPCKRRSVHLSGVAIESFRPDADPSKWVAKGRVQAFGTPLYGLLVPMDKSLRMYVGDLTKNDVSTGRWEIVFANVPKGKYRLRVHAVLPTDDMERDAEVP